MRAAFSVSLAVSLSLAAPTFAWWDAGHMRIAGAAYAALEPTAWIEADRLIALNPRFAACRQSERVRRAALGA